MAIHGELWKCLLRTVPRCVGACRLSLPHSPPQDHPWCWLPVNMDEKDAPASPSAPPSQVDFAGPAYLLAVDGAWNRYHMVGLPCGTRLSYSMELYLFSCIYLQIVRRNGLSCFSDETVRPSVSRAISVLIPFMFVPHPLAETGTDRTVYTTGKRALSALWA